MTHVQCVAASNAWSNKKLSLDFDYHEQSWYHLDISNTFHHRPTLHHLRQHMSALRSSSAWFSF